MGEKKIVERDQDEAETGTSMPRESDSDYAVNLPKSLNLEEKKYLVAIERGDIAKVKRMLLAATKSSLDIDCVDSLGRGGLALSIEAENLEMVELLVVMGVETKDALLRAIDREFVEAVELLLEHEELLRGNEVARFATSNEGEEEMEVVHSWQRVDPTVAKYPPGTTPLILAAQRDNYEILELLLNRGATLPMPHDVRCGCPECSRAISEDSIGLSSKRLSEYRALSSPCLIALSSPDPVMTAFQLGWELRELAIAEPELGKEYTNLRWRVEKFAVDLLDQVRRTSELSTIIDYDPESEGETCVGPKTFPRLEVAVNYEQKRFVAHPRVQQFIAALWYEGVPGFRRMSTSKRLRMILETGILFPIYCTVYLLAPESRFGARMRQPFVKFLVHASSYIFFLLILILVSQRAEVEAVRLLGGEQARRYLEDSLLRQRGMGPSTLECLVFVYVLGFVLEETREMYVNGFREYLRDLWNVVDFTRNTLYLGTVVLRVLAYVQQWTEIGRDSSAAMIPRENWSDFDPQLIAEGLFSAANIFSALKLVHLFSIDPHLGPLQISLGRMVIDIVKFFFIYALVLFAFACGLNQLLWYFADLERRKCYDSGELGSNVEEGTCDKWRRFSNLFESCQSLFWASFGGVGIDSFELTGIKSYTRFWGLLMFGSYCVINVIVLLNLLIAMMSNSYSLIEERSDTEWKFARTKLWLRFFETGGTLPPPFNLIPSPKTFLRLCGFRKKSSKAQEEINKRAMDQRYEAVSRALVWRYVVSAHCRQVSDPVSEDDVHELRSEMSSWRCELLEIFRRNGMDVTTTGVDNKETTSPVKKMKVWERRLMKDFQISGPKLSLAEEETLEAGGSGEPKSSEDNVSRWKRVARLAVLGSAGHRWGAVVEEVMRSSQIGKSNSHASLECQRNLKEAIEDARRSIESNSETGTTNVNERKELSPAAVGYVNERRYDPSTKRSAPIHPNCVKKGLLGEDTETRSQSQSAEEDEKRRPSPAKRCVDGKKMPEIRVTSTSPMFGKNAVGDVSGGTDQRMCRPLAKSPRISKTRSPNKRGGWL